ncbi:MULTISPECIES: IS66 family transposase [Enterobacter]|uniref:IS66 family transposase n=2 Tax=Enterobacteriaceae TaxID=543 RepID=UPI00065FEB64|nr:MULTISPECIES: IS66 family transposase [Enterobacter]MCQ4452276.1 IS66 family transposase [Enterobacter asburiae]MCY1147617.1 IS66 family transposase [Enterobacter asburiae]SAB05811.1 Transposase and inactivated derivatives [Enterobacter asburiae]HDC4509293.1 IS66 family transposase [Enterobacter asburiae]HDW2004920.1 IS66 family transposase [Enterobacter asburiae]
MKNELPDDIDQLKALLRKQRTMLNDQQTRLRQYAGQLAGYEQEINRLKAQLDKLRRMLFGQSSEKSRNKLENKIRQAEKRLAELENRLEAAKNGLNDDKPVQDAPTDAEVAPQTTPENPARNTSRKPLPADLPRETQTLQPADSVCPSCGGELKVMGETISEQLEIINTAFKVIETVRPKLACSRCDVIVQAPLPAKPVEGSRVGSSLLARILVGKYVEHTPLYRQSEIYARHGLTLSRNTMVRWVAMMGNRLRPLYEALNQYVLQAGKVHTDDTPVRVLEPGSGKTRTGRLWVYVRDDRNGGAAEPPAVWFSYSADRKGEHPQRHLCGYRGVLQADAYGAYDALYESGHIREAACMAHARRKIHDEHVRRPTAMTGEALKRIAALYIIEAEIRGLPPGERLTARKERTVPLMQSLYDWVQEQMKTLSEHAEMAKAFAYMLKQWDALNEYCRNGQVEIDNNIGENALRSVAVGRKNYLFFGSDNGGEAAAVIYSLVGTCKLNGVEPEGWLRDVISKINAWPSNRLHELLPWNLSSVK